MINRVENISMLPHTFGVCKRVIERAMIFAVANLRFIQDFARKDRIERR